MTTTQTNPYADLARLRKAMAIADVFTRLGTTAYVVGRLSGDREAYEQAAGIAGVNPPSDEAWALVVHLLRERERLAVLDPFVGL